MKNYKQFFVGMVVGGVLLGSGSVLADNIELPSITNWVKYKINGEYKALPSGYTTLNYQNHTYVPTRFISEQLGAEVKWDDNTNTVSIEKQVTEDKDTDNQEDNTTTEPSKQDSTKYEELPVSKTVDGVRVEIYSVENQRDYTKLYVIVKNTNNNLVQLDQGTAYFQSELGKYSNKNVTGVQYWKDTAWFRDIGEDQDSKGYIMLPPIPEDERQGKFYVEVFENSAKPTVMEYEFDMKW